jgi:SAM-dependent methyltransferase
MIEVARRRLSRYAGSGRAELVVGDAGEKLPFPSKHFDAVISVELIECLPPAKRAQLLKEIRRVLKPAGRVLMEHTDWDTQVWNVRDKALARKLVHAFCDWTQGWMATSDGWMGRRLLGLFRGARCFGGLAIAVHVLTNDRFQPGTYGYDRAQDFLSLAKAKKGITLAEARRFLRDLKARHREGSYFYSVTRYVVTGERTRR